MIEVIAGEGDFEYADCKGKYFYKQVSHFLKFSVRNPTCERVRKAASELLGKYVGEHHIELVNTRLYRFVPRMNI